MLREYLKSDCRRISDSGGRNGVGSFESCQRFDKKMRANEMRGERRRRRGERRRGDARETSIVRRSTR
eukprot:751802-Hanusia_phi.AAC.2